MAEKERASRQVIVISLITAACLIGDSMLYIVLPICFAFMTAEPALRGMRARIEEPLARTRRRVCCLA